MTNIHVLIADHDHDLACAIGSMLINRYHTFRVTIAEKNPRDWTPADWALTKQYDLILLSPDPKRKVPKECQAWVNRIVLCDLHLQSAGAAAIASELQYRFSANAGLDPQIHPLSKQNVVCFSGASGGVGKTSLAVATARELASYYGYHVFFLSFEEWCSADLYLGKEPDCRGLNEYLYYLFSEEERHKACILDAFTNVDEFGVRFFRSSRYRAEAADLRALQSIRLLEAIQSAAEYDCICVDLADATPRERFGASSHLLAHILIEDASGVSRVKNERCYAELLAGTERTSAKLIRVTNAVRPSTEPYEEATDTDEIRIDYDPTSFVLQDDRIHILSNQAFNWGVKRIADAIRSAI